MHVRVDKSAKGLGQMVLESNVSSALLESAAAPLQQHLRGVVHFKLCLSRVRWVSGSHRKAAP